MKEKQDFVLVDVCGAAVTTDTARFVFATLLRKRITVPGEGFQWRMNPAQVMAISSAGISIEYELQRAADDNDRSALEDLAKSHMTFCGWPVKEDPEISETEIHLFDANEKHIGTIKNIAKPEVPVHG